MEIVLNARAGSYSKEKRSSEKAQSCWFGFLSSKVILKLRLQFQLFHCFKLKSYIIKFHFLQSKAHIISYILCKIDDSWILSWCVLSWSGYIFLLRVMNVVKTLI